MHDFKRKFPRIKTEKLKLGMLFDNGKTNQKEVVIATVVDVSFVSVRLKLEQNPPELKQFVTLILNENSIYAMSKGIVSNVICSENNYEVVIRLVDSNQMIFGEQMMKVALEEHA